MQISCERCATVYELDDRLIPPGGAAVQCTRCGYVFTAHTPGDAPGRPAPARPSPVAAPAPAPTSAAAASADAARSTQFFGATGDAARAAAPAAADSRSTQLFGAAGAMAAAAEPPPARGPAATQFFGASPSAPATFAAEAPAQPTTSTPRAPVVVFSKAEAERAPAPAPVAASAAEKPAARTGSGRFGTPVPGPIAEAAAAAPSAGPTASGVAAHAQPHPQPSMPAAESNRAATVFFGQGAATAAPHAPAAAASPAERTIAATPTPAPFTRPTPEAALDTGRTITPAHSQPAMAGPTRRAPSTPAAAPVLQTSPSATPSGLPPARAGQTPAPGTAPAAAAAEPAAAAPAAAGAAAARTSKSSAAAPQRAPTPKPGASRPAPAPAKPKAVAAKPRGAATEALDFEQALLRRRKRIPMIMGGIGVAILLAIGLGFLLRRGTPPVDPALAAADDVALQLLKRDDTESIKKAIEAWEALEAKAPEYIAAKANQIIAQVLLTQDLRDEQHRLEAHRNAVDKEIKRLTDAKQPEDWEQRVTAKREEMVQLKKLYDPLIDEASKRDERAGALLKASKALVEKNRIDHIAVMRASAVYYAAKMSDTAERLADSYRKAAENGRKGVLHDDTRAWADFAMAMLDAQPRLSAEKRDRALASIAATRQKDPALLRSYLFEAKVRLASKEWALAKKAIADLRAANPNHSAALKMLAEIEQAEAAAAKAAAEAAAIPQQ